MITVGTKVFVNIASISKKILKKCEGVSSHDTSHNVPHDLQHMQQHSYNQSLMTTTITIIRTDNHKHYHIETIGS